MAISIGAMLGLQTRFHVSVDGVDLGGWSKCAGLVVQFHPEIIEEGGNYEYKPILPGRIEYKEITLTRAMNAADSNNVQQWLRGRVSGWINAQLSGGGGTAQITLFDSHGNPVTGWSLRNVYPSKWEGPELQTDTFGIALESLTLAHEGFL